MSTFAKIIVGCAWVLGAVWVLVPHRFEGDVILVISDRLGWGIHKTDPLGIIMPLVVTALVRRFVPRTDSSVSRNSGR